jgi:hypothetical protein
VNTSIAFQGTSDIAGSTFLWGFDAFSIELEDPVVPFFGLGTQSWFLQVTHAGFAPCHRNGTIDIVLPTRRRAVRNEVP